MLRSTDTTCAAPRDANSKDILPVPLYKSSTLMSSNSIWFNKMLNNASLAKSVVGRTGKFFGGFNLRPFKLPPMIRIALKQQEPVFYVKQFYREVPKHASHSALF